MFNFFKKKEPEVQTYKSEQIEDFNDILPISKYFHNETGITFDTQITILKSKVTTFCKKRDIYSFDFLLKNIQTDAKLKQELTDHLTTNETYFYRELKQIMELVQLVKNKNSKVNILCAPSATGEEPYSIAIALLEAGVPASNVSILGIDINSQAIQKSQDALYGERNLRNLSPQIVSKYFIKKNEIFALTPELKSLVSFEIANLFDPSFKSIGKFDFVFSRNMLIYFDKETKIKAKSILENLRKTNQYDVFFGHADLF